MDHSQLLHRMIEFDRGDPRRIQHFLKVYLFASLIGKGEGLPRQDLEILEIAGILHDIGIHPAESKYGSCNGKLQEQEGPAYARKLLEEAGGFSSEFIERVCFLIAHHHTYQNVAGLDWQILLEADFLVNAYEDNLPEQAVKNFRDTIFKTATGIRLLNTEFDLKD